MNQIKLWNTQHLENWVWKNNIIDYAEVNLNRIILQFFLNFWTKFKVWYKVWNTSDESKTYLRLTYGQYGLVKYCYWLYLKFKVWYQVWNIILILICPTLITDYSVPDKINLVGDKDDSRRLDVALLHQVVQDGDRFLQRCDIINCQDHKIAWYGTVHLN